MKMILSLTLIMFSIMMFFLNHPLAMGLMILIQTFQSCILTGMLIKTYWFSYILFLTFLGGLLVLFIYVSSIASNELFKISLLMKIFTFIMMMFSIFISFFFFKNIMWMNMSINSEMYNFFEKYLYFNNENKINLIKMYNSQTYLMMMLMILYLLITLIAVIKITNIFYGPLRPFN